MSRTKRLMDILGNVGFAIAGTCMMSSMLIITANAICRKLRIPLVGAIELSTMLLLAGGGFIVASAAIYKTNIEITVLTSHFSKTGQRVVKFIASLLEFLFWDLVLVQSIRVMMERMFTETTDVAKIPYFPFRLIMCIGLVIMAVGNFINLFANDEEGGEENGCS